MVSLPRVHDTSFARVGSHLPVYSMTWLRSRFLVLVAGDSTLPVINARAKPWERRGDWFCFPGLRISSHGRVSNVRSYGRHLYRFSIVRGEPCICLTCLWCGWLGGFEPCAVLLSTSRHLYPCWFDFACILAFHAWLFWHKFVNQWTNASRVLGRGDLCKRKSWNHLTHEILCKQSSCGLYRVTEIYLFQNTAVHIRAIAGVGWKGDVQCRYRKTQNQCNVATPCWKQKENNEKNGMINARIQISHVEAAGTQLQKYESWSVAVTALYI